MKAKHQRGRIILSLTPKESVRTMDALGEAVEDLGDDTRDARFANEYEVANRYERIWRQLDRLLHCLDKGYNRESKK